MTFVNWALEPTATSYLQQSHIDALHRYGEKCLLRVAWTANDVRNGHTTICTACQAGTTTTQQAEIAAVYVQAGSSHCNVCYGTGFTGGFQPGVWITFAIIEDYPDRFQRERSGLDEPAAPRAQFMWVPTVHPTSLLVRVQQWASDGSTPALEDARYSIESVDRETVRTGAGFGDNLSTFVGQTATIVRLPWNHSYYTVPVIP